MRDGDLSSTRAGSFDRPIVTVAELEQMSPSERERLHEERVVMDLSVLPADLLAIPADLLARLLPGAGEILTRSAHLDHRAAADRARREGMRAS